MKNDRQKLTASVVVSVSLLLSAHTLVLGQKLDVLPVDPTVRLTRIAFGSCAKQGQPQPIWKAIADSKPDLFIFLGDNIYGDTTDMHVLKEKYARLAGDKGFQRVTQTCPILATWDDHDYGADDAGEEYPKKKESQQIFLDFFGESQNSVRRQTPGIYDAKIIGPPGQRVQIILLDTRYFRGPLKLKPRNPGEKRGDRYLPNPDPAVTLLGETQWQWLEERLQQPAEVRIIVSSIQVITDDHDSEHWSQLPHERERLFKLIRDTKAAGEFFLSGDVHRGELTTMDGGVGYPLFDLTSSGLNRGFPTWRFDRPNRHRIGSMQWGNNFGMIVLEWDHEVPRIKFQVVDEEGDIAIQRKVDIATLQPGVLQPSSDQTVNWKSLFDGKTLAGWVQKNGTAKYEVKDGTIVGTTVEGSWNSFLCTTKEFADFELQFEVGVDDRLNSGVQIRSTTRKRSIGKGPNKAAGRVIGPQIEIEASRAGGAEAGYIYAEATGLGWLTPKQRLIPHKHFRDGQWNHYRIVAIGPRIRTWINGMLIEDLTDEKAYAQYPRGFIGLQVHRIKPGAGPYSVTWRSIRIKEF